MSGSVNKVILIGYLGRDPESRSLNNGNLVVSLRMSTNESWRDKQTGERRSKSEWHNVVIFNEPLAKVAEQYLRKGSKVYIEGQLQTREWTDKDNVKRYSTEVVLAQYRGEITLLDSKGDRDDDARPEGDSSPPRNGYADAKAGARSAKSDLDDDIPF
ncbi:MAG: single-stranded DNA-binding protein [Methylobacterium sp.]|nr:single-stranded DNA-binding protein [Methylobacterium sp.]MCA3600197.1 single-stranded DNA-binding protein [Methylobacterium sp.]MCA3606521.1 single-stranded DNA-binding protein [Methylobacterium sp.]MCA4923997.1 single-stranded DNA-binding protein [Methylobacterium sp.]